MSRDTSAIKDGVQVVTFSKGGLIQIEAGGAGGGYGRGLVEMRGGRGAKASGVFKVTSGQTLKVAVGQ